MMWEIKRVFDLQYKGDLKQSRISRYISKISGQSKISYISGIYNRDLEDLENLENLEYLRYQWNLEDSGVISFSYV